jgi:hypothetical protein
MNTYSLPQISEAIAQTLGKMESDLSEEEFLKLENIFWQFKKNLKEYYYPYEGNI